jgi:hypothetical protein
MMRPFGRARGGVKLSILLLVLAIGGAVAIVYGYRFYERNVAPVVSKVASVAKALNIFDPYEFTTDHATVRQWLVDSLRIEPPQGYQPGFGLRARMLGKDLLQMTAMIPEGVPLSEVFEGGRNQIRFRPGRHTLFLAVRFGAATEDEMQAMIAGIAGESATSDTMSRQYVEAGGRKVAVLRGTGDAHGERTAVAYVFLDDSRMLFAMGPQEGLDEPAFRNVLAAIVATHPANRLLYNHSAPEAAQAPREDPCGIAGLPADFDVVAIGVGRGSLPLDVAIDRSGRDVAQEDVVVGETPKPVVLVLMGEDPIVWRVGRTETARIAGVLATGASRQAVIGLPASVPVTRYSREDGPNACPHFGARDKASGEFIRVDRRVKELLGRRIAAFQNKKGREHFAVGNVQGTVVYAENVKLKDVALGPDVVPGGLKGIAWLVERKRIRLATERERSAWLAGASAAAGVPQAEFARRRHWHAFSDSVYVVLEPFELPPGLAGAHSRTFLLPPGAPMPTGDPGHCTFLHMDGFVCSGTSCR